MNKHGVTTVQGLFHPAFDTARDTTQAGPTNQEIIDAAQTAYATHTLPVCHSRNPGLPLCLDRTMPAQVEKIGALVEEVMGSLEGREDFYQISLVLREAVANAVVHGCREDAAKKVRVHLEMAASGAVFISVRDPGPGFDPDSVPSPLTGCNLLSGHGRGIFLIRRIMDEVRFRHRGSEIRMRKRI